MTYLPLVLLAVFLLGFLAMGRRARARSAAQDALLRRDITVGSQVMTTSGLYGTVVAMNSDDTVILAIAPGVEVRWAFAALRDADSLPSRYRRGPADEVSPPTALPSAYPAEVPDDSGRAAS